MKVAPIIFFKFNTKSPQAKSINFKSITQIPKEDEFVQNTGSLDIARLKQLGIKNFRLIDSNSIRGVTLANQKRILLRELKECGINTIIDLRKETSGLLVSFFLNPLQRPPKNIFLSVNRIKKQD